MRPADAALLTKAALEPRVVTYEGAGDSRTSSQSWSFGIQGPIALLQLLDAAALVINRVRPLVQQGFQLPDMTLLVSQLVAQLDDDGAQRVEVALQLLDGRGGSPMVVPGHASFGLELLREHDR